MKKKVPKIDQMSVKRNNMPFPSVFHDQRLIVNKAPLTFLKKSIIKSHFGKYGPIQSISIDKTKRNCIITFQKSESAEIAKKYGSYWQKNKLDIKYAPELVGTSSGTSFGKIDNIYDIESELNWFAEDDFLLSGSDVMREDITETNRSNSPKYFEKSSEPFKKKDYFIVDVLKEPSVPIKKLAETKQTIKSIENDEEDFGEELLNKSATNLNNRLALLEERDKLLRIRLNRDSNIKTASIIKGLCPDMCPEKERMLRDVRGMVSSYESIDGTSMKMDHSKAIKDYVRSSADQEEPLAHELRPEPVLSMTMDYLITQIMTKIDTGEEDNLGNWYDFCWYRLRSIRKDIIQQHLCDINTVEIVERCARFHICCFDRLWGCSKSIFDDKINSETLMNCLQTLMHMYEDLRKQGISCFNEAEFRAYLILLKLNSGFLLSEYQQYPPELRLSPQVKDAVQIHTAFSNKMYSTYFNLMKKTSYLNCCLMQRFLAHLRTKAMEVIVRAHCPPNKISRIALNYFIQTLKFDSREDCINYCESFGLVLAEDSNHFIVSRSDFYFPETLIVINTPSSILVRKRVSVAKAVVGVHKNLPVYIPHQVHSSFNDDGTLKQGAVDASDQEEKMYRDIVERKLILKRGSLIPTKLALPSENIEMVTMPPPTSPKISSEVLESSSNIEPILENISSDEEIEYQPDEYLKEDIVSEMMITEDVDAQEEEEVEAQKLESFNNSSSSSQSDIQPQTELLVKEFSNSVSKPENLAAQEVPLNLSSPSKMQTEFISKQPEISFKVPEFIFKQIPIVPQPKSPVSPVMETNLSTKKKKISPSNSPSITFVQVPQRKVEKCIPKKENKIEEKFFFKKLKRVKVSEQMKKASVRKCALLWKRKAEKWKSISDKSLRDYLFYWGTNSQSNVSQVGFRKRLNQKKKNGLVVLSILHTGIVDRIDPATSKVGELLSYSLAKTALNFAWMQGNVSQRHPIFWKLMFALPPSLDGNFTFPDKLRNWCKAAFYCDKNTRMGDVQCRINSLGIPVFMSFDVILGSKTFEEKCSNMSAAVVIRANGWETIEETQQRCEKLISVADSKFPMTILTLGDKFESCNQLRNRNKLTYFYECLWNDTDKLVKTLLIMAEHTFFQNLKVDSIGAVISVMSEKLFDALHEDKFINDNLYSVLCEPNNIILLYNELINKIEKEIIACYEANFYGTACEFEQNLRTSFIEIVQFPTHYNDVNFREILKEHLQKVYLPEIKWPFATSKDLFISFKNYCQKLDCEKILSKLIRIINPPDSDDFENPLGQHLEMIPWLRIVEDLVKVVIKEELFNFKIVYRESKLTELIDSHWWMCSDIVVRASCT